VATDRSPCRRVNRRSDRPQDRRGRCSACAFGVFPIGTRGHALRRYVRAYGDAHRPPIAQTGPSSRALQVGAVPDGSRARPSPGPETSQNGTDAAAGRGGRLWHARGYAPPRIRRRGWLARRASRFGGVGARPGTPGPRAGPPGYDDSSARRDHQASAAVSALSASPMPPPASPAVAARCRGMRARAPGSQRCSSRVSGSGAVPS